MNVGELKELIKNLDDDTPVVLFGQYDLGDVAVSGEVQEVANTDEDGVGEKYQALVINTDHYLLNQDDVGLMDMVMPVKMAEEYEEDGFFGSD